MNRDNRNPFNITKAVDFTNPEINEYFVDFPDGSYVEMVKPNSPMPMIVVGGKGSGKTHLMRYFSYDVQLMRRTGVLAALQHDGFLGLYFRCSGLNTERFGGKGQPDDVWRSVFEYYMELWIGQVVVDALTDVFAREPALAASESAFSRYISRDGEPLAEGGSLATLLEASDRLRSWRAEVDFAVNNSVMTRSLNVEVRATRGSLIFGLGEAATTVIESLRGVAFVFLIDEFENLDVAQQMYINTLVRERQPPSCIKIGVRRYGLRTFSTYSAGEENREGSEYELLDLDKRLRLNAQAYEAFSYRLIGRRLIEAHIAGAPDLSDPEIVGRWAQACFETVPKSDLYREETAFVVTMYSGRERPYMAALRTSLKKYRHRAVGVPDDEAIDEIVARLSEPDNPFVEKLNLFLFYRRWSDREDLCIAAREIGEQGHRYALGDEASDHKKAHSYFGADLYAQLLRNCRQPQRYLGLPTFIEMSNGFPRHLLVILKNVVNWSAFEGRTPFAVGGISMTAQEGGVREASDWFLRDAGTASGESTHVKGSIERLATLFREIRFSDKPSDCSVIGFSVDGTRISQAASRTIQVATEWSLLIESPEGRRDKNSMRVDRKFQLNSLLCPRWDLPIYLRATFTMSADLANAVFDPSCAASFETLLRRLTGRMNAPFAPSNGDDEATTQAAIQF
jgi:hypothetical protein